MRYRNSKPALVLRWITLGLIVLVVVLSFGDCLFRTEAGGVAPGVDASVCSMPLGEVRYLMLASALLLILRHYGSDMLSGVLLFLPTTAIAVLPDIMSLTGSMGIVEGGLHLGTGVRYEFTVLGMVVSVLACVSLALVWFMALVLKQPPKTEASVEDDTYAKMAKNEKTAKTVIIVLALLLVVTLYMDVIVGVFYRLLHGF